MSKGQFTANVTKERTLSFKGDPNGTIASLPQASQSDLKENSQHVSRDMPEYGQNSISEA